jgi:peptide/nickel transport system substrate-binding protein
MSHTARRRSSRPAKILAIAVAGVLALTGCAPSSDTAAATSVSDSIVVAAAGIPTSWAHDSGIASTSKYDYMLNTQGFLVRNPYVLSDDGETLMQDTSTFEGDLAESYDVSEDGLTYTFHLRTDAVSAAGNPLTADDVIWSYERKFNTDTSSVKFVSRPILSDPASQIAKVDDHTVTITVASPGYGFTLLGLLANSTGAIFDSVLLKSHATAEDPYAVVWSDTNYDSNYGFGPYMVESVSGDTEMVLVANPNHFGDAPEISKITYKVIADPGTWATALKNGEVQVAFGLRSIDSADMLSDDSLAVPDNTFSNQLLMMPLVTNKAPFDNELVRQAFAYAVPYDQIIENVYSGRATKADSLLDPTLAGYDDTGMTKYTYDTDKAQDLLAEAGMEDGVSFTLTYPSGTPDIADAAIQIQSLAADAGFTVTLEELPVAAFTAGRAAGEYQSVLLRDGAIVQAPSYVISLFTGQGATTNYSKWEVPEFYAAVDAAIAVGDPATEAGGKAWNAAERILWEQEPIVFIAKPKSNWAVSSGLVGAAYRTDAVLDFASITLK